MFGPPPSPPGEAARQPGALRVARAASAVAAAIGLLALAGWQFGVPALRSVVPGLTAMNPLTALCLVLAALAAWLLAEPVISPAGRTLAQALAVLVALVGLARIGAYLFGVDLGLDRILYPARLSAESVPNRMAPNTAVSLVLAGAALGLTGLSRPRDWAAQWLALAALVVAVFAIIGYAYGANELYGLASYIPMALNTAVGFCALSVGTFCLRVGRGLSAAFSQPGAGGILARRLLPAAILVPPVLGWLAQQGVALGYYGAAFGAALFSLATLLILALAVWRTAAAIQQLDAARQQAEAGLARERDLLRALMDSIPDTIYFKDRQSRFTRINRAHARFLGVSQPEAALGKTDADFQAPDLAAGFLAEEAELMRTGKPVTDRLEFNPTREGQPRWLSSTKVPLHDPQGEVAGLVGISRDITERMQAAAAIEQLNKELEQRAAQLALANQELESFSYSVSHDLRAPLRAIDGFSQALLEDSADRLDQAGQDYLRRVRGAAQRMALLIDDLLQLSRVSRAELARAPVDLSALAAGVAAELQARQPERTVEFVIGAGLTAWGDARLLRVALENLLGNAWKFTSRQPAARIEFGAIEQDGRPAFLVRDNGAGFDMAYAQRLFGAFQRLHSASDFPGTGVGLATVKRIIRRHGGRIWAEAAPGQGATFYFTLPAEAPTAGANHEP